MTLAQLGADVIRFDPLRGGLDYTRWPITKDGTSLFWAGLNKGKRSIAIDYYVLGGPRAMELADLLVKRQSEGIAIRVLLDPELGTLPALKAMTTPVLDRLREAEVPVRFFPVEELARKRHFRYIEDHTKVVVADGVAAFVGSLNFGAELLHNHDVGLLVEGNAAHAIMGDVLTAFALAKPLGKEKLLRWPAGLLPTDAGGQQIGYVPTGLSGTPARSAVLDAIAAARRSIRVMMFEFEDGDVATALAEAHQRGVDVQVLVDPNEINHLSPIGWAPRGVFNLNVANTLSLQGVPVRWFRPDPDHRQLHAKAALIDGDRLYAGSTNWNHCSFDLNNETMLTITGGSAPGRFEQLFETDWSDRSELVAERPTIPRLWFYQALAYMLN